MKQISLYDYQARMLRHIEAELAKGSLRKLTNRFGQKRSLGRNVMVQIPTGTGKTYVMAAVIKRKKAAGEVWMIAHRRELVEQMEQTLEKFGMRYAEAKSVTEWKRSKMRVMSIQLESFAIEVLRLHDRAEELGSRAKRKAKLGV